MQTAVKKSLLARLGRIEGQVRGLRRLVEKEVYCIDIITQAEAAKHALNSVEALMLKNHLETHARHQMQSGKGGKAIKEILKVYTLTQHL